MFCKYCGKKIENYSEFCKYCGKELSDEVKVNNFDMNDNGTNTNLNNVQSIQRNDSGVPRKNTNKKTAIIISSIAAAFLVLVIAITLIVVVAAKDKNSLNKYERMAYQQCLEMKNMLKNPDSFRLYDDMVFLQHYDEDGYNDYTYFIFEYGGTNGFGAMIKSGAIFKDGEFIMDDNDDIDDDDYDTYRKREVMTDLSEFKYYMEHGKTLDDESWKIIEVNVNKIKKKMGLK